MKVIVKLYRETGSREDWQTLKDIVLDVPDGTDLRVLDGVITDDLNSRLAAPAFKSRFNDPNPFIEGFYVMVDVLVEATSETNAVDLILDTIVDIENDNY